MNFLKITHRAKKKYATRNTDLKQLYDCNITG